MEMLIHYTAALTDSHSYIMECHEAPLCLMVVIGAVYGAGPGPFVFVITYITSVLKVNNKYDIFCHSQCCMNWGVGVVLRWVCGQKKKCSCCLLHLCINSALITPGGEFIVHLELIADEY